MGRRDLSEKTNQTVHTTPFFETEYSLGSGSHDFGETAGQEMRYPEVDLQEIYLNHLLLHLDLC